MWRDNLGATQGAGSGSLSGGGGLAANPVDVANLSASAEPASLSLVGMAFGDEPAPRGRSTMPPVRSDAIPQADATGNRNLLAWQLLGRAMDDGEIKDASLDSTASDGSTDGDSGDDLDSAAIWEDETWLQRLGRGV